MKKIVFYMLSACLTSLMIGVFVSFIAFCYVNSQNSIDYIASLETENTSQGEEIQFLEKKLAELKKELRDTKSYLLSIPVEVTAYNPTTKQCDDDPFVTASLTRVEDGIIALSRDLEQTLHLKFGDLVTLKTSDGRLLGTFRFQDRMNKKWIRRVDIFMWDESDALNFGIKSAHMYIQRVNSGSTKTEKGNV